jgi:hypothetical protein
VRAVYAYARTQNHAPLLSFPLQLPLYDALHVSAAGLRAEHHRVRQQPPSHPTAGTVCGHAYTLSSQGLQCCPDDDALADTCHASEQDAAADVQARLQQVAEAHRVTRRHDHLHVYVHSKAAEVCIPSVTGADRQR